MAGKKQYKKPEIKKIDLAPEECCVTGCKTATGADKGGRLCRQAQNCNNSNQPGS